MSLKPYQIIIKLIILFFVLFRSDLYAQYCKPIDNFPETGGYIGFGWGPTSNNTYHNGADFAANVGENVYAIQDGQVIYSMEANGFGSLNPSTAGGVIIIKHRNNNGQYYYAVYGHLYRNLNDNTSGMPVEQVTKGQVIGTIRPFTNGSSYCPHLHLGIFIGSVFPTSGWGYSASLTNWRDPRPYLDSYCGPMENPAYPDVRLVKGSSADIFLLKNNILHRLTDWSIYTQLLQIYDPYQNVTDAFINQYFKGSHIISDGLMCKEVSNPVIYLIQYNKKRSFTDENVYTSRGYKLSGGDPISPTVLWLPDGMLSALADGANITTFGETVTGDLYFKKNGQIANTFSVGETIDSYFNLTGGDGYTVFNYVRITFPDGSKKFAYYPGGDVSGSYSFSNEKIPLRVNNGFGLTFNIVPNNWNGNWLFNSYTISNSSTPGQYTVEFWYEDINKPGVVLCKDIESYTIQQDEQVTTPNTPMGSSTGKVGQSLSFSTSGSSSSLGHSIEYQFDWGDGTQSNWGSATRSYSYNSSGNKSVKARARCQTHTSVVSNWSNTKSVSISYCTLTINVNPSGAGSVSKSPNKTNYTYNESVQLAATANSGYQFDHWGGDLSGSTNPKNLTMSGNKSVTAYFIQIQETISTPNTPSGPSNGTVGQSLTFNTGNASSSLGHSVEYQFDWGDGIKSSWGADTRSYSYNNTGIKNIKARARCQTHTDILSNWSASKSVTISSNPIPDISVNPSSWNYGNATVNQEQNKTFIISNVGNATLNVSNTVIGGVNSNQFIIVSGGGNFTIAAGGSHNIIVKFKPTSTGEKNAYLRISNNDPDENPKDIILSGTGSNTPQPPEISINPLSWDFGDVVVNQQQTKTIVVSNLGGETLVVTNSSIIDTNADQFSIESGGGAFNVSPSSVHNIVVKFRPTSPGTKTAKLKISSNDPDESIRYVNLSGNGTTDNQVPDIAIYPTSWNFGRVVLGNYEDKTFVVKNNGTADLVVSETSVIGAQASEFSILMGGGTYTLSPNENRNLTIRFQPSSAGTKTAKIRIRSNDPDEATRYVELTGRTKAQDIAINPSSLNFGDVNVGAFKNKTFVIENKGDVSLEITDLVIRGNDHELFSIIRGNAPLTLSPGDTIHIIVRFSPTSQGDKTANVRITSNDPDESIRTVSLNGVGVTSTQPILQVEPLSLNFNYIIGSSTPQPQLIQISNIGTGSLSWTITDFETPQGWLSENPLSGVTTTQPNTVTVAVNPSGLSEGIYSGNITITAQNAQGSPKTLDVSLNVSSDGGPCNPPYLKVLDVSGVNGDEINVSVVLAQNLNPINAFGFKFIYPNDKLSLIQIEKGNLISYFSFFEGGENQPGIITIGGFDTTPLSANSEGTIVKLKLRVNNCLEGESSQLLLQDFTDDITNLNACSGTFTCESSCLLGDVNMDGAISPGDALCAFQVYINGGVLPPEGACNNECALEAADVSCSQDGVTPGDALYIFQAYINGLTPPLDCDQGLILKENQNYERKVTLIEKVTDIEYLSLFLSTSNLSEIHAFGAELGFDTEKLQFIEVRRTSNTMDWEILDGKESLDGVVIIGGFAGESTQEFNSGALAEIVFGIKSDKLLNVNCWLMNLVDDLKSFTIEKEFYTFNINAKSGQNNDEIVSNFLIQNYPNPFNSSTLINYQLPVAGQTKVEIINMNGQLIKTLVNEEKPAGDHSVDWNGYSQDGNQLSSGIYFIHFVVTGKNGISYNETKKIMYIK